ncbi:MAG: hypothetical protein ACK4JC_02625 [Silanimonas lenta]
MVSLPLPGASIASIRSALPLPEAAAEALWSLAAPLHRGEPRRFLNLARDERHWRLLAALHALDPALAALGFAAGPALASTRSDRPVRALRQALSTLGIGRVIWRDLVRHRLQDARGLFDRSGPEPLISHLRLASLHGEALPFDGPIAEWVAQFRLSTRSGPTWHLAAARWELSPALAVRVLREGLRRLADGHFAPFVDEELPVVAAWHSHLGKGAARARWSTLLARARAAEATEERALTARGQRWETGMTDCEFAGIRVTALGDGVALWREGLRMRHCVGDYAPHCLAGINRIFHLDTGDGSRGWTLSLEADGEGGWEVDELRGPLNALPPAPLKSWAREWAQAYSDIFESDPSVRDDERPEICMICRGEYCEKHLVLYADSDEGIIGGRFKGMDKDLERDLKEVITELLLAGKPAPPQWPSEWTSIHTKLAKTPKDELFDLIDDEDDGPRWEAGDAFHDAWLELGGQRTVTKWIEEWAMEQSETLSKYTEVSTAPGLSWCGWNVFATDPEALLVRFNAHVAALLSPDTAGGTP